MSSNRGFFIGQLVDDLALISHQVDNRCRLGHFDLNRMLEDFFRDVLNLSMGTNLDNLNNERLNEPGIDLGDEQSKVAFQITSQSNAAKINKTLEKITDEQLLKFNQFYVLVIGAKQKSYKVDIVQAQRVGFLVENIIDINDLCKLAITLHPLKLQELHSLVAKEVLRVRVELELPESDGTFATNLYDHIEGIPEITLSNATKFYNDDNVHGIFSSLEEAKAGLDAFAIKLSNLPRISREFLLVLLERSDDGFRPRANADVIQRISRYPDTEGELRLLSDKGFVSFEPPEEHDESPYWAISFPGSNRDFEEAFYYFVTLNKLSFRTSILHLDFSAFG
ncbi:MAG: SMEK domain-containing protein [Rhodospirillales bacterium]|nr:SMEK domain-containing protein [Rhodospirillales bacterium]